MNKYGSWRARPLGRVSTGKKVFVPNLFSFLGFSLCCPRVRLSGAVRTRHFVSLIPEPPRTAIRSVTHLVLARAPGILFFL
jgi:hypothetical protein